MVAVALDKTGTLTIGRPRVQQVHAVGWSDGPELLSVAAGLEEESTHPIAAAIREAAQRRGVAPRHAARTTFVPGRGVSGVFDGRPARLGTLDHVEAEVPVCLRARVAEVLGRVQQRGDIGTVIAPAADVKIFVVAAAPERARRRAAELRASGQPVDEAAILADILRRGQAEGNIRSDLDPDSGASTAGGIVFSIAMSILLNPAMDIAAIRSSWSKTLTAAFAPAPRKRNAERMPRKHR